MNFLDWLLDKNYNLLAHLGPAWSPLWRMGYSAEWFIGCMLLFAFLAKLFGSIEQKTFPSYMHNDALYWFVLPLGYAYVSIVFFQFYAMGGMEHVNLYVSNLLHNHLPIRKLDPDKLHFSDLMQVNVFIQAFLLLLISDFFQYWLHRWFHNDKLWKYHAIHHSPTHIDWLTSARFHPVNIILYSTSVNVFVAMLGFDMEAFLVLQPFNMLYSPLVHANLKWNYGPFKYFLASPVFHRWHHTHVDEGGMKNFAPTFPFLDLMFGTFYMPKGKQPEVFGIVGNPVPENFIGQMVHPFKKQS